MFVNLKIIGIKGVKDLKNGFKWMLYKNKIFK